MTPSVTVRAWLRRPRALMVTGSLNCTRTTNFLPSPEWPGGNFVHWAVSEGPGGGGRRPSFVAPPWPSSADGPLGLAIVPPFNDRLSASRATL